MSQKQFYISYQGVRRYPGINIGVRAILNFQFSPPRFLYVYDETKPLINPKRTYKMIMTVVRAPRLLGDRNPKSAKTVLVLHWEVLVVAPTIMNS
jgi:hypothetical protein